MHTVSDCPTSFLLQRVLGESRRLWRERSTDHAALHAVLNDIRTLLLRLQRDPCCVFLPGTASRGLCAYENRLEHMTCPYVEADEREGPEILSAVGFALRDLGVMSDAERVRLVTVVMESRCALQDLDRAALCGGRGELQVLSAEHDAVVRRKEAVRGEMLQRIAAFLGEDA